MRESTEAIRSFLSSGDLPDSVTILGGDGMQAFDGKVSRESGAPPGSGATVAKFDRSCWPLALFVAAVAVTGSFFLGWDVWRNPVYVDNPGWTTTPTLLIAFMLAFALFILLHAGFAARWLILEKTAVRFRVRRFLRYRTESFPIASIREIAVEIVPTRRSEIARLTVTCEAKPVELFRGPVHDAEKGAIRWAAGLLGAVTGLPVTDRRLPGAREVLRRRFPNSFR